MKLYMHPFSPNARRARIAAKLSGLPVEEQLVDLATGANKAPEYLAINPNGKVPTLVDGDFKLWESMSICQYLAAKGGKTNLWPTDAQRQADVNRWQSWTAAHWGPAIGTIVFEVLFKQMRKMGPPDAARIAQGKQEFQQYAVVLEAALKGRDYLCGKELTLAEVSVSVPLQFTKPAQLELENYPNIRGWWSRLSALDAWKSTEPQFPG